jgi:hypothetical protein
METKNIRIEYKSTQLISILQTTLAGKMNLARIKVLWNVPIIIGIVRSAKCKQLVLRNLQRHLKRLQNQARRCAAFSVLWRNTRLTAI